jgi:DoxX-like family
MGVGIAVPRLAIVTTAYVAITVIAAAANAFSGIAALAHFAPIRQGMLQVGVPRSWLRFPIGTLKTAGAAGLLAGLAGVPYVGTAAAIGLVLFFVCAVYTHVLADDYSPQFGLALGFLLLNVLTLVVDLVANIDPTGAFG